MMTVTTRRFQEMEQFLTEARATIQSATMATTTRHSTAGKNDDYIFNNGDSISINAGGGKNLVYVADSWNYVTIEGGNDSQGGMSRFSAMTAMSRFSAARATILIYSNGDLLQITA